MSRYSVTGANPATGQIAISVTANSATEALATEDEMTASGYVNIQVERV